MQKQEGQRVPTISKVSSDTLIELVFDKTKGRTALAVSRFNGLWNLEQEVKIETGEILVPYSASNSLISTESILLPSQPTEFGLKSELIGDITDFIHRYVDLHPQFERAAAYYVLLSWVYDAFNELPYLRLRGEYGTGKTRALMAIGSLCYKSFFSSGASTMSPIFHIQNTFGGTLVLDEADLPYSDARAGLIKLFNNGNVKGMPILRSVQNGRSEYNPHAFQVYGPKIVGMRENFQDLALESRFITEETGLRGLRADIPLHLTATFKQEALELRNRLLHFRLCEYFRIKHDSAALIEGAEPRLNQIALPLLSLIDDLPVRQEVQQWLVEKYDVFRTERRETSEGQVLAVLCQAMTETKGGIRIRDITARFNANVSDDCGEVVTDKWIGYLLRVRLRINTKRTSGSYVVPGTEREKIHATAARYGINSEKN